VRILVISARLPMADGKGDQSRMFSFLRQLSEDHELTVVSAAAGVEPEAERVHEYAATHVRPASRAHRTFAAGSALLRGRPGQVGWMITGTWGLARRLEIEHDVVLINTIRSLGGRLTKPVVLDHVDALSLNLARRAGGSEPAPVRAAAAVEARLLRRYERWAAGWVSAQVVTSAEDARHLPSRPTPHVIPVAWDGATTPPDEGTRDIDLIFTGNMRYPPNARAAHRFAAEILPRVRNELPYVNAWVVGRAADQLGLRGVRVAADVPDLPAYLRRARVAVLPLEGGTGSPYKVLEAAACGAAIVTTPWAARVFDMQAEEAVDTDAFATRSLALLRDEPARRRTAVIAQRAVAGLSGAALARRLVVVLAAAAHSGDRLSADP
jgi:polysaccharide biosynthesis protein PslH